MPPKQENTPRERAQPQITWVLRSLDLHSFPALFPQWIETNNLTGLSQNAMVIL